METDRREEKENRTAIGWRMRMARGKDFIRSPIGDLRPVQVASSLTRHSLKKERIRQTSLYNEKEEALESDSGQSNATLRHRHWRNCTILLPVADQEMVRSQSSRERRHANS